MRKAFMNLTLAGIGILCGSLALAAPESASVPYPAGYRNWFHVKSTLIGPQHPRFETNGGLHHFYANEKGVAGYKSGMFPDGAVLVDDLLEVADTGGGITSEVSRRRVAVMVKNSARYRETGGWGFEIFRGEEPKAALDAAGKAVCFACHGKQKDRDLVYSQIRQ